MTRTSEPPRCTVDGVCDGDPRCFDCKSPSEILAALEGAQHRDTERCAEHPANPLELVCVECFESDRTAAATERAEAAEARLAAAAKLIEQWRWCADAENHLAERLAVQGSELYHGNGKAWAYRQCASGLAATVLGEGK